MYVYMYVCGWISRWIGRWIDRRFSAFWIINTQFYVKNGVGIGKQGFREEEGKKVRASNAGWIQTEAGLE
jgi:hypothetical protein